jgi:hypothetical protein
MARGVCQVPYLKTTNSVHCFDNSLDCGAFHSERYLAVPARFHVSVEHAAVALRDPSTSFIPLRQTGDKAVSYSP